MRNFDFDGKTFALLANSENGEVSKDTLFHYKQNDGIVTAEYSGGSVKAGKLIAKFTSNDKLEILYQCITNDGELKAGSADAKVSIDDKNKIRLDLDWRWLNGDKKFGASTYVEID